MSTILDIFPMMRVLRRPVATAKRNVYMERSEERSLRPGVSGDEVLRWCDCLMDALVPPVHTRAVRSYFSNVGASMTHANQAARTRGVAPR
jgi:hypothetical protein